MAKGATAMRHQIWLVCECTTVQNKRSTASTTVACVSHRQLQAVSLMNCDISVSSSGTRNERTRSKRLTKNLECCHAEC